MHILLLAGVALGLHFWLAAGVLFATPQDSGAEIVFVSASFGTLGLLIALSTTCILVVHLLVRRVTARHGPQAPLWSTADMTYALPLCLFGVSALALLTLVLGPGRLLPVVSYLVVDLRWWWTTLVLAWVVVRIDRRAHGWLGIWFSTRTVPPTVRRWLPEATLVALAVTWVVAGTPFLRFTSILHGDEPKYLRFCELLYQGQGFELSQVKPLDELPADFKPQLWQNVVLAARVLPGELRSLGGDVGAFIANPTRTFNRAKKAGGFITGKNGGSYQVYTPGVSFLMFPAYYIDRQLSPNGTTPTSYWPAKLTAVHLFFLSLYAAWVLLLFRFLHRLVGGMWVPWITTVALMLTMPAAAFPFQFYPEMAAGVIVVWVAGHLLFPRPNGFGASLFAGVLAGYLPWLHVRFSAVSVVLALSGIVLLRQDSRRVRAFAVGAAASLGCLSLYAYYLTGSILPWAMWNEESKRQVLSSVGAVRGSFAYFVDSEWGLFAHAPVYLLALPGYWWMARWRPDVALITSLVLAALVLPAAAHTLTAAGSTPMRLIVAALPFAGVPLAELLARRGRSSLVQVAFAGLLLVSLQNALAYNLHHYKTRGPMLDFSFSGWKSHMLFPLDSRDPWQVSAANGWLLVAWFLALAGLLVAPLIAGRMRARGNRSCSRLVVTAVVLLVLLGTGVSAATGRWGDAGFRMPAEYGAERAAELLAGIEDCVICVSSARGFLETGALEAELWQLAPDWGGATHRARREKV